MAEQDAEPLVKDPPSFQRPFFSEPFPLCFHTNEPLPTTIPLLIPVLLDF